MRVYELALVFKSSLSESARKKLLEAIKKWLSEVKILKEEEWGEKAFSYPIKKEKSGFYCLLSLEGELGVPSNFEKRLLGEEDILRHLLIRKK